MMIRSLIMLSAVVVASSILVTSLIIPIGQTSTQQEYVFAQGNTVASLYNDNNKTTTDTTFFPQIHNYTSSPPGPVNSCIIETTNGVVVIDTQRTLSEAKNLVDEIKKINKPILGVIITHPHPDHIGGTAVLLNGTANVPIYSSQTTFDHIKNDTEGFIAITKRIHGNDYADQIVLPNRIVNSGENLTIDGITYRFENIGPGEAADMTIVYLPSLNILFTGDLVNNRMHPALVEGRSSEWIKQIEHIGQNYSDSKILFPGHGQAGSPRTLLDEQLNYINRFRSLVEQQMQSAAEVEGGERATANITEEGKTRIKSELQRLYPNYLPVASLPTMLDLNIDAVAKEISQDK
jgi:glyoxylase-like metal-dependent hydrolase (beta-lactamase superfamily II)